MRRLCRLCLRQSWHVRHVSTAEGPPPPNSLLSTLLPPYHIPTVMAPLISTTTGCVYTSDYELYESGTPPSFELHEDHPFRKLWRDHLEAITTPESNDRLIDAYVAISLGHPHWNLRSDTHTILAERQTIRRLLRDTPPDVVVVINGPCTS